MNPSKCRYLVCSLAIGGMFLAGLLMLLSWSPGIVHVAAATGAGNLFVRPGGGGNCSQGSPCGLQAALSQAVDGDTLYLAQGTYTGAGAAVVTWARASTSMAAGTGPLPRPSGVAPPSTLPRWMVKGSGGWCTSMRAQQ